VDIHPPHAIRSWKDFGLQLATITVGILIALSLEGVRESLHNGALAREARENIRREIVDNKKEVEGEIAGMERRGAIIDAALRFATDMLDYAKVQRYASVYTLQDLLTEQHRRALDALSEALGIVAASEGGDPTNASPAEIERFREQIVRLRSIMYVEEQMARRARDVSMGVLE